MKQKKERNIDIKRHGDIIIIVTTAALIFLAFFSTALVLKLMSERREKCEESSVVYVTEITDSEDTETTTEESTTTTVTTTESTTESKSESLTTTTSSSVNPVPSVSSTTKHYTTHSTTKSTTKTTAVQAQAATKSSSGYKVTQEEIVLLRKLVANEYGADWVPVREKAKIVASIMAQVKDKRFPNTVKGCIYKTCVPYGFNPNKKRTISKSVIAAVDYYFANADTVFKNWTANSWWGDGKYNHFRRT